MSGHTQLPNAPIDRLIRNAGAKRVSEGAVEALAKALEDWAMEISTKAAAVSKHAGRKTVNAKDVKLALRT